MGRMRDTFDSMPATFVALFAVFGAIVLGCVALDGNRVGTAEATDVGPRADGAVAEQRTNVAGAQANVEADLRATVESLAKLVNTVQADVAAISTGPVLLGPTQTGDGNVSVDCGGGVPRWLYLIIFAAGILYPAVIRPARLWMYGPERRDAKSTAETAAEHVGKLL